MVKKNGRNLFIWFSIHLKRSLAFTEIKFPHSQFLLLRKTYFRSYHLPWDKTHLIKVRNTWQPHLSSELSKSLKSLKHRHTHCFNKEQQFHESFCLKRFTRGGGDWRHWKCWNSKDNWQHAWHLIRTVSYDLLPPHWRLRLPVDLHGYFSYRLLLYTVNNIVQFNFKSPIFFNLVTWWTFILTIFPNNHTFSYKSNTFIWKCDIYILVTLWLICMNLYMNLIHTICLHPTDRDTGLVVRSGPSCFF